MLKNIWMNPRIKEGLQLDIEFFLNEMKMLN